MPEAFPGIVFWLLVGIHLLIARKGLTYTGRVSFSSTWTIVDIPLSTRTTDWIQAFLEQGTPHPNIPPGAREKAQEMSPCHLTLVQIRSTLL